MLAGFFDEIKGSLRGTPPARSRSRPSKNHQHVIREILGEKIGVSEFMANDFKMSADIFVTSTCRNKIAIIRKLKTCRREEKAPYDISLKYTDLTKTTL